MSKETIKIKNDFIRTKIYSNILFFQCFVGKSNIFKTNIFLNIKNLEKLPKIRLLVFRVYTLMFF